MSRSTRVALAVALAIGLLGVAGPAGAQGDDPFVVSWVSGGSLVGFPVDSFVAGQDYVVGDEVELFVNGIPQGVANAELNAEGTGTPSYEIAVFPGDEVKLVRSIDAHTQTMVVADLAVTSASPNTDVVSGTADPHASVAVALNDALRFVTADASGAFSADFSVPGQTADEQTIADLQEGMIGYAIQFHEGGNLTAAFWMAESMAAEPSSKSDCKKGGWESLTDAAGTPFKNQGDCVSYVATGGRNPADG